MAVYSRVGLHSEFYDTQGVLDGEDEEEQIYESIRSKRINLLILCVSMLGRAQQSDTRETISLIIKELGSEIWERAVIVLTMANAREERCASMIERGRQATPYSEVVDTFVRTLRTYLSKAKNSAGQHIHPDVIAGIPFVPAGIYRKGQEELRRLPDCEDWLSSLWIRCFRRCDKDSRPAFIGMASDRLRVHRRDGRVVTVEEVYGEAVMSLGEERLEAHGALAPVATSAAIVEHTAISSSEMPTSATVSCHPRSERKRSTKDQQDASLRTWQVGSVAMASQANQHSLSLSPTSLHEPGEEENVTNPGPSPSLPPGGAIHISEEELDIGGVLARTAVQGAAIGTMLTGFLGVGVIALSQAAESGSVHQKILLGAGTVLTVATGTPGALVGGLIGAAVGGIRLLAQAIKEDRAQSETDD